MENEFKNGDWVEVTNEGMTFSSYKEKAQELGCDECKWKANADSVNGEQGKILNGSKDNWYLVEFEGGGPCGIGRHIVIGKSGLKLIKNKKTIMKNVIEFVKQSLLSAEEKSMRKNGLKDSCGEYTQDAKKIILDKLTKENEKYLIEIAQKMDEEEAKKA